METDEEPHRSGQFGRAVAWVERKRGIGERVRGGQDVESGMITVVMGFTCVM